ncbi:hypothetical protein NM688_g4707 [Phlebia brevispora]|uniref:Uncharacterized protein n=1 Tax=Phlebia brevispora TaxID=194682 RepID=A0ACC1T2G2_9APHY|nr:hypothetical protein NM688_g4707 [Phlebia brevispora]
MMTMVTTHPSLSSTSESGLCPSCPAAKRLVRWCLAIAPTECSNTLNNSNILHISQVTLQAWASSTASLYESGLLAFHSFCDKKGIDEADRAPVNSDVLALFLAALAGSYAKSTITNYYALQVQMIIHASERMVPADSRCNAREPYMLTDLAHIFIKLDPSVPLNAAVQSCSAILLFGVARSGEFTVKVEKKFNPAIHITRSHIREVVDCHGN